MPLVLSSISFEPENVLYSILMGFLCAYEVCIICILILTVFKKNRHSGFLPRYQERARRLSIRSHILSTWLMRCARSHLPQAQMNAWTLQIRGRATALRIIRTVLLHPTIFRPELYALALSISTLCFISLELTKADTLLLATAGVAHNCLPPQ
jgi:hypothetical protein